MKGKLGYWNSFQRLAVAMSDLECHPDDGEENHGSQLNEQQLHELMQEAEQEGTKTATKWAMKKFRSWLEKRSINLDLATTTAQDLATSLYRFYAECNADKSGEALSPSTLIGLRAGIQRGIVELRNDEVNIEESSAERTKCWQPNAVLMRKKAIHQSITRML